MGNRLKLDKFTLVHLIISALLCLLFLIGVVISAISKFVYLNENECLFNIVSTYSSIVLICSLIPIEPILLIINIISSIAKKRKLIFPIGCFLITTVLWIIYACAFVGWTGGV